MIRNFFVTTLRGLKRSPLYSVINIVSLGVSLAIGLLVLMMLSEQINYDYFHPDKDRIYRVLSGKSFAFNQNATVPMPLAEELINYDADLQIVQLTRSVGGDVVYGEKYLQLAGYFADPTFFDVFGFELSQGSTDVALSGPNNIVITDIAAKNLFGNVNPLGQVVHISERGLMPSGYDSRLQNPIPLGDFTVTGVVKSPPNKSHLNFDLLLSSSAMYSLEKQGIRTFPLDSWDNYFTSYTYLKVPEHYDLKSLNSFLTDLSNNKYTKGEVYKLHFELQGMTEITPGKLLNYSPSLRMPKSLYFVFGGLVMLIVFIASFNYANITIARAMVRAKEVGIRKVSGASRLNLILQFLIESIIYVLVSTVLAFILLMILKPAFAGLHINQYINYDFEKNLYFVLYALVLVLSIGLLAGLLPSIMLSKLKPSAILKSTFLAKSLELPFIKKFALYKVLVFSQFFISVIFIVTTLLISKQSRHYFNMDTGFNKQNMLVLDLQGHDYGMLANRFAVLSAIEAVEASDIVPGAGFNEISHSVKTESNDDISRTFPGISVSPTFLNTYEIDLLAGRSFDQMADKNAVLINMKGVAALGHEKAEDVVGLMLDLDDGNEYVKIIGVVEDFQSCMPLSQNEQLIIRYLPEKYQYLSLKLTDQADDIIHGSIEAIWKDIDPVHPANYDKLDNKIEASVSIFKDISSIITFVTTVNIFISCFGLLGITAYVTERRIKEVGIRKVFGANFLQLHHMLSWSFVKLILISSFVAAPFAYLFNGFWLSRLANKVSFGFETILLGVALIFLLAFITVSIQVIRLSLINPINVLREE